MSDSITMREASLLQDIAQLKRERDEALGALKAQDKRMEAAGKKCGVPFEVFGCDWPDRVAEEINAVADERNAARKSNLQLQQERDEALKEFRLAEEERVDMAKQLHSECVAHARCQNERDEARAEIYRGTVRHDDPTQRELSHLAGVVGALRERNRHLFELLRLVDAETRQPSERFDEAWAEVREVLRG